MKFATRDPNCLMCQGGYVMPFGGHILLMEDWMMLVPCSRFKATDFHDYAPSHNDGTHDPGAAS